MIGESMLLPVDVYELDLGHVGGGPPDHVRGHGAGVRGVTCSQGLNCDIDTFGKLQIPIQRRPLST